MSKAYVQDSHYTLDVKRLVKRFNDHTTALDSDIDRAASFFQQNSAHTEKLNEFERKRTKLATEIEQAARAKRKTLQAELDNLKKNRQQEELIYAAVGVKNHQHLHDTALNLLHLAEGDNYQETLRKSAQFLGTLQLLSPTEGKDIAEINEKHKRLYQAVLALRLLDELIQNKQLSDPFIDPYLEAIDLDNFQSYQQLQPEAYQDYFNQVKVAVVMSVLLQDIGLHHPDAKAILSKLIVPEDDAEECDDDVAKEPEVLSEEERKHLLQINSRETQGYIKVGLAPLNYVGNSREEKQLFNTREGEKLAFIARIIKGTANPKSGIANLIKVPQIYTSIVLSTKSNYNYKLLPNVFKVLNLNAERGACHQSVVDSLLRITGVFPQGYGMTYIPKTVGDQDLDYYEYAVVSQLYPEHPLEPVCRQATRNLTFIGSGNDIIIKRGSNLYFPAIAKRFAKLNKKRLLEILERLASNFEERKDMDILPRCWSPTDYFTEKNNQKLWNRHVD